MRDFAVGTRVVVRIADPNTWRFPAPHSFNGVAGTVEAVAPRHAHPCAGRECLPAVPGYLVRFDSPVVVWDVDRPYYAFHFLAEDLREEILAP